MNQSGPPLACTTPCKDGKKAQPHSLPQWANQRKFWTNATQQTWFGKQNRAFMLGKLMLLVPTCINLNNIMLSEKTLQKQLYSMIPFT